VNVADGIDAHAGRDTRRATRHGRPRRADIDAAAKEALKQGYAWSTLCSDGAPRAVERARQPWVE
jgi:hypothetical protein